MPTLSAGGLFLSLAENRSGRTASKLGNTALKIQPEIHRGDVVGRVLDRGVGDGLLVVVAGRDVPFRAGGAGDGPVALQVESMIEVVAAGFGVVVVVAARDVRQAVAAVEAPAGRQLQVRDHGRALAEAEVRGERAVGGVEAVGQLQVAAVEQVDIDAEAAIAVLAVLGIKQLRYAPGLAEGRGQVDLGADGLPRLRS